MECSGHQISFQYQLGLVRDRVTVDSNDLNLKSLKSLACDFISDKCPQNGITRLPERIMLFKHDYNSSNILQVRQRKIEDMLNGVKKKHSSSMIFLYYKIT